MLLRKGKILALAIALGLYLFFYSPSFAEIKVFFSPKGGIAEEITKQIDNAQEYIDIAMYSLTYEPIAEAIIRAKNRGVKIRILMDNKIAIIDGRILFTGSYNWSKSAEERNEENLLEFIDEEEIIEIYQERLDYLWEFNKPLE